MARKCIISGKEPLVGNNVSHAHNKSKRRQLPNLQSKRIFVSELNRFVRVKISTRGLKTVNSKGLMTYLSQQGLKLKDVELTQGTIMARSNVRETIKLKSTESPHVYSTKKNKRNTTGKLEVKKYDPVLRKHVLYKEAK